MMARFIALLSCGFIFATAAVLTLTFASSGDETETGIPIWSITAGVGLVALIIEWWLWAKPKIEANPSERMYRIANAIAGSIITLFGVLLLLWIAYNLFIERPPETQGRNPIGPAIFAVGAVVVGARMFWTGLSPNRDMGVASKETLNKGRSDP